MHTQFDLYKARIDETIIDVGEVKDVTTKISRAVTVGTKAVQQAQKIGKTVEKTEKKFEYLSYALTALQFVSPIKTPIKLLNDQVKRVDKNIESLNNRFVELDGRDDISTLVVEGRGEFLAKVETNLKIASVGIVVVQDSLTLKEKQLEIASEALGNIREALAVGLRQNETWSGDFNNLNTLVENQLGARNAVNLQVSEFYNDVAGLKDKLANFIGDLDIVNFEQIFQSLQDLDAILKLFDVLQRPLELAGSLIEPIAPLLNAVSAFVSAIVDPVIDYLIETLGIKSIIEDAEAFIDSLLPPLDLLDKLKELFQVISDTVLDYITNALGTVEFLDLIENAFFGNVVGDADAGPTGWGDALDNTLDGDAGDDILDGLGGRDEINGGGGNDIIIAGEGSDTLDGGTGDDMFYFGASFTEYEFSREPNTDNIYVSHLKPKNDNNNTGVDLLVDLDDGDNVVFTDISFTGQELKNAIIGTSILQGTGGDDLMFLNSNLLDEDGNPVVLEDGFFVANGYSGNDRIFGSTQGDRLNGGRGNDILIPGDGDDEANGDQGVDTYQVLEGADEALIINLVAGSAIGQGNDTITSIENVIAAPDRPHFVHGSDVSNAIYTGDSEDIITGLAGNDTIDGGDETDSIIAGAGADVIYGGGGSDVMVSGSAAVAGVVDTYHGGTGVDWLSYSSSANTIREVSNSDTPNTNNVFTNYMNEVEDSGAVRINGDDRTVDRYDLNGNKVTTDITHDVEGFMGSDLADTITGSLDVIRLHGAGGNDTIRSGGSVNVNGGSGDDLIFAQDVDGGPSTLFVDGGAGVDRLDLDQVGDARWFYQIITAISLKLRAHDVSVEGDDLRGANNAFFTLKPTGVEQIRLGNFDDHVVYEPGGGSLFEAFMLDGNDRFDAEGGFADVHAGQGNDVGNFDGGGSGIFRGQRGDDYAIFDDTDRNNQALMGFDNDTVRIERFNGYAEGNDGYDIISFDVALNSRLEIDLQAGTAESFKGSGFPTRSDQVDMTLTGFEEIISGNFNDLINGSVNDEQIIARGGNDTVTSQGGSDRLFGGAGNDRLFGGGATDQIHGGLGDDYIHGGTGRDTASFSWVRPDGVEGALIAGQFGSTDVNLVTGVAVGQFGSDTLVSIENVIGSGGNDLITGNNGDNLLSGGDGNDSLFGNGGDDILITGKGMDFLAGDEGDDIIVVGVGVKELFGGAGTDTLDFGTVDGVVTINFETNTYAGTFIDMTPRWQRRDLDQDGVEESNGYEVRFFNGVGMTPQQVLEANPLFSNSVDDTTRVLPEEDDDDFDAFLIEEIETEVSSSGLFGSIEQVIGGESGANIIITSGIDRFDGRISDRDVVDFTNEAGNVAYNFQTGATNVGLLTGDEITDIEGVRGGLFNDALTGDSRNNFLFGNEGKDVLKGSSGDDELDGEAGDDFLRGGGDDDTARGGADNDKVYGDAGDDMLFGNSGHDELVGDEGRDTLNGGSGDDTLRPGEGVDRIFGGKGVDVITYNEAVQIYLSFGLAIASGGTDTFNTIENATGSKYNDRLDR